MKGGFHSTLGSIMSQSRRACGSNPDAILAHLGAGFCFQFADSKVCRHHAWSALRNSYWKLHSSLHAAEAVHLLKWSGTFHVGG